MGDVGKGGFSVSILVFVQLAGPPDRFMKPRKADFSHVRIVTLGFMARILGAADIGSNTVHLLVAATDGELVTRLDNLSEWVGLGEVVARSGFISNERIDHLLQALKECRRVAQSRKAESLYVFATEAMRAAKTTMRSSTRSKWTRG